MIGGPQGPVRVARQSLRVAEADGEDFRFTGLHVQTDEFAHVRIRRLGQRREGVPPVETVIADHDQQAPAAVGQHSPARPSAAELLRETRFGVEQRRPWDGQRICAIRAAAQTRPRNPEPAQSPANQ